MHLPYLAASVAASFFCSNALALRVPVKDVREYQRELEKRELLDRREAAAELKEVFHEHEKRIVCLEDLTLLSLQSDEETSVPFCSAYLGIEDTTSTTTATGRTTVIVIGTTYATISSGTTTVHESTVTVTASEGAVDKRAMLLKKRQGQEVTPPAALIASCSQNPQDSSLLSRVSSGCSCLFVTTGVDVVTSSTVSTRTISGIDYRDATIPATVTSGVTTVTVSATPTSLGHGGTGSVSFSYSGNGTMSTGTANSGTGSPSGATDTRDDGGVSPTGSATSDASSLGPRTTTYPPTLTSVITSIAIATSTRRNGTDSAGTAVSSGTSISMPPSNTTITSPTGTGFPPLQGCPSTNGSRYTTQCQTFEISCYVNYGGPITQGLIQPDVYECIEGCAIANVGFSQLRCYAVSYIPSAIGPNCFFKTEPSSLQPVTDSLAVSALLIASDTCSNNTSSISATIASTGLPLLSNSSIFASPTGFPTLNLTSGVGPTGSSGSSYSGIPPSMTAFASMNISTISDSLPTAPNFTIPTPTNSREGGCDTCISYTTTVLYSTSIVYQTV